MNLPRTAKFCRLAVVAATAVLAVISMDISVADAGQLDTKPPSAEERRWMSTLLERLGRNASGMPIPVTNTVNSLTKTISWKIPCARGTRLREVEVVINTEHVAWDPRLTSRSRSTGLYYWGVTSRSVGGFAKIIADNWLMIDANYINRHDRKGGKGVLEGEALLYHELLHGELMILAMGTSEWQRKACNMVIDLERHDQDHGDINPAVDMYVSHRSSQVRLSSSR